ncbi:hypothetical protein J6590_075512 [Homalodisca vitripennis]|nr:hypothetical protein J6590_075512 [Homalodisca vitripennis]
MLNRKKRRWLSRPWIMRREELGASARLLQKLQEEDPETYRNVLRMSAPKFQEFLELVEPLIKKQNTKFRQSLPCKIKLEITLRLRCKLAPACANESRDLLVAATCDQKLNMSNFASR